MKPNVDYKENANVKIGKIFAWCVVGIIFSLTTSMSGCVMYSNSVEAEVLKAETELLRVRNEADIGANTAIVKLIESGVNPIAARCAIYGFNRTDLCGTMINQEINLK